MDEGQDESDGRDWPEVMHGHWQQQQRLTAAAVVRWSAVEVAARAREESGCRAGRWRRHGGGLWRAAARRSSGELGHKGGDFAICTGGRRKEEHVKVYMRG
jgi:hypothetical protein